MTMICSILAGYILRTLKLRCDLCISDLMFTEKSSGTLISVKDRGGLIQPPSHVITICNAAEATFRQLASVNTTFPRNAHKIITTQAMGYVLYKENHRKFASATHSTGIIKEILSRFTSIRIKHEVKRQVGPVIRSKLNRLAIFIHV